MGSRRTSDRQIFPDFPSGMSLPVSGRIYKVKVTPPFTPIGSAVRARHRPPFQAGRKARMKWCPKWH
jgi:hypothetical protein